MSYVRQSPAPPRPQRGRATSDGAARPPIAARLLSPEARTLSALADVVSDALILIEGGTRVVYANDRAATLLGGITGDRASLHGALARLSEHDSAPEAANGRLLDLWRRSDPSDVVVLGAPDRGELAVRIAALAPAGASAALAAVMVADVPRDAPRSEAAPRGGAPAQVAFAAALSSMLRHQADTVDALARSWQARDGAPAAGVIERLRRDSGFLGRAAAGLHILMRILMGEASPDTTATAVDLSDLLMAIMPRWKPRAPRHSFELALAGETPRIPAIEPLATMALDGLLEAATAWTPGGGVIRVTVRSSDDGVSVTMRPYTTGQYLGPRSEDAVLPTTPADAQLTDALARANVGLALAGAVLEAHGGRLSAEPAGTSGLMTVKAEWTRAGPAPAAASAAPETISAGSHIPAGAIARGGQQVVLVWYPDPRMLRYLRANLASHGLRVVSAEAPSELAPLVEREEPDAVLLDLEGGIVQTKRRVEELRSLTEAPVLVLASDYDAGQCADLLNAGAADYVGKPFNMDELIARLRVALRTRIPAGDGRRADQVVRTGDLCVDLAQRIVTVGESEVRLSRTEFKLLRVLAQHMGTVLAHEVLLERVWGASYTQESDFVWVYVRRLRRKIEPDPSQPRYVLTVPGVGYRLARLDVPLRGPAEP